MKHFSVRTLTLETTNTYQEMTQKTPRGITLVEVDSFLTGFFLKKNCNLKDIKKGIIFRKIFFVNVVFNIFRKKKVTNLLTVNFQIFSFLVSDMYVL